MKRIVFFVAAFVFLTVSATFVRAAKPTAVDPNGTELGWENSNCPSIQSGTIIDSAGNPITLGYDQYGYNYQAHMFNGYYDNYSRPAVPVTTGDKLIMKWSDAWLANVDCDRNGKLDRGLVDGVSDGISKGWLTNHVVGDYTDGDGNIQNYTDFVKIVWTGPSSPLWGEYTIIEEVWNDPAGGLNGLYFKLGAPGFGLNDSWTTLP